MDRATGGRPRVCVFCGAKSGNRPCYLNLANAFGTWLGESGMDLIYGGGGVGLMGALAKSAQLAGAHVTGVVPYHLLLAEGPQPACIEVVVARSMHHRKAIMYRMADAFVVLPGGLGTLDELLEITTWAKLGLHSKPAVILNSDGFFDDLLALLDHAVGEGMMTAAERKLVQDVGAIHEIGDRLDLRAARYLSSNVDTRGDS